ncbi:Molybdopterin biosynthesis MoaE, partial [Gorgonomyces haynaldii]
IDLNELQTRITTETQGSLVVFVGTTRNYFVENGIKKSVEYLEYTAYEPMALKIMNEIAQSAIEKYQLLGVGIVHRLGVVSVKEASIAVLVSSSHRENGFTSCEWIMNDIKRRLPVWKKEHYSDGSSWKENKE